MFVPTVMDPFGHGPRDGAELEVQSDDEDDGSVAIQLHERTPRKRAMPLFGGEGDEEEEEEAVALRINTNSPQRRKVPRARRPMAASVEVIEVVNLAGDSDVEEIDSISFSLSPPPKPRNALESQSQPVGPEAAVDMAMSSVPLPELAEGGPRPSPDLDAPPPSSEALGSAASRENVRAKAKPPALAKAKKRKPQKRSVATIDRNGDAAKRLRKEAEKKTRLKAEKMHYREQMLQLLAVESGARVRSEKKKPKLTVATQEVPGVGNAGAELEVARPEAPIAEVAHIANAAAVAETAAPALARAEESLYQVARARLQERRALIGRREEAQRVEEFLRGLARVRGHGAAYISGPSGVGKSLTVGNVVQRLVAEKVWRQAVTLNLASEHIPCLLLHLADLIGPKRPPEDDQPFDRARARSVVEECCRNRPVLLVLEECDQKQHLRAVCELFQIAGMDGSLLALVGIGNKRTFIAKHQLRAALELTFASYRAEELVEIVREKVGPDVCDRLFEPNALRLWSTKVSESMGDLRSAVSCLVKMIDIAETEYLRRGAQDVVKVGLRAATQMLDSWGSTKDALAAISGLAPQARILLIGVAKELGCNVEISDADVRRVFCRLTHQERPDPGVLRRLLEALLDTPFLVGGDGRYSVKLDPSVVEQAIKGDAALSAFVK